MGKWSTAQCRSYDDFRYGSFDCYVTKNDVVIRGVLKKTGAQCVYMKIGRKER